MNKGDLICETEILSINWFQGYSCQMQSDICIKQETLFWHIRTNNILPRYKDSQLEEQRCNKTVRYWKTELSMVNMWSVTLKLLSHRGKKVGLLATQKREQEIFQSLTLPKWRLSWRHLHQILKENAQFQKLDSLTMQYVNIYKTTSTNNAVTRNLMDSRCGNHISFIYIMNLLKKKSEI